MPGLDRAIGERNRELLARRLNWPPGALDECRKFERDFPGWYAWWTPAPWPRRDDGPAYGASPVYGPAIARRMHYCPAMEGLRTQVRQDIRRHQAGHERGTRPRPAPADGIHEER